MNLTRAILSTCAVASSIVCISAYSVASSEPSVKFTVAKPCSQESAPKPKMEILEPLGPLHDIAEPDILEAFKSRVGAMKASGEYDRRFNQNKDRIARELEHPTPVLVNGTPAEVSEKLNRRVFFDQGGALVRVFGIKAVPALLFNGPEGPEGAEFAPDQLSELLSLMPQP